MSIVLMGSTSGSCTLQEQAVAGSTVITLPAVSGTLPIIKIGVTQTGAVATGTTQIPSDDTIPQNTEGDEYMTLAFTPNSATSTLIIQVTIFAGLVLCTTHLSEITLVIAANAMHTFFVFLGKPY